MNDNPRHAADPSWTRRPAAIAALAAVVVLLAVVAVLVATSGSDNNKDAGRSKTRLGSGGSTTTVRATSTTDSTTTTNAKATTTTTATSTTSTAPATTTTASSVTTVPPPPPPSPGFSNEDPGDPKPAPVGAQGPVTKGSCANTGPPTIAPAIADGPSVDGKQWRTVGSASGNCGGRSDTFRTSGVDTRIVVRSDADQFLAYLENVDDPGSNAGYADVVCRSTCSDQAVLVNPAGAYRLRVEATDGPWLVEVQEYR